MLALALAIISSTSVALMLKVNDVRGGNPLALLAGNYLMASVLGGAFLLTADDRILSLESLLLGAVLALGFMLTFFVFAKAVGTAGTALATVSSRISLVIPVVLSMLLFGELPSGYQFVGFVFTFLTLALFYLSTRSATEHHRRAAAYLYLLILLVGIGVNDFGMKLFLEWRSEAEKPFFLLCIFAFAFIYTLLLMRWRGVPHDKVSFRRGLVLGIPNILSSFFLLSALASLKAIFVYPAINIGVILLTALGADLIWRERLNAWGRLALVAGAAAIVLMGMGA